VAKARILLDTHCWLWLLAEPSRFSPRTLKTVSSGETELFLSAASLWEVAIKHDLGKLKLPEEPAVYMPAKMTELAVQELAITGAHALAAGSLPRHHADPFDRLILAQAKIEGLSLLSSDRIFVRYGVKLLPL